MTKELPKLIMKLIKCGDIPEHFSEEHDEMYQFYLKSGSTVINCYWKYAELNKNFPDCKDLKKSYNIIRFEVQYRYPKISTEVKKFKQEVKFRHSAMTKTLKEYRESDFLENRDNVDETKINQLCETYREDCRLKEIRTMEKMLSDETCTRVIDNYFTKIIKSGDYYTFDDAKRIIRDKVSKWEKEVRLTNALNMIRNYGGISKVKDALGEKEREDFIRTLRELANLGINPITIPKEWGIGYIPNLLDNYFLMRAEEQRKEKEEKEKEELLREYFKSGKRKLY